MKNHAIDGPFLLRKRRKDLLNRLNGLDRKKYLQPWCVKDLIKLICDIKTMEQSVIEMEYDTKKAPLGKITTEQVTRSEEDI